MSDGLYTTANAATARGGGGGQPNFSNTGFHQQPKFIYPKPEAEYQEIIQNPDLFSQKLQSFHSSFGTTKLKIPKLGGKSLDLHHLFVEVTSRGGIEKLIRDRRWKEVTAAFKFPSSLTSASFVLRKYYLSLLYHFEQVYYFRKEETSASATDSGSRVVNGQAGVQSLVDGFKLNHCSDIPVLEAGSSVIGTIDAKCDYGYLVSVEFGSEKLNGVLYHVPEVSSQMSQRLSSVSGHAPRRRRRRKLGFKDPSRPKRNKNGYNIFFAENYARLKPSHQGQERAITQKIGILWNKLSESEKQVYRQKGQIDKERYRSEMRDYNTSHNS
ncbi:OLC1v1022354C1 [Oldenlandia corymbosa var. corymbosa]|uniref:OLC1v1022354C1 n=1 Tax=Oldenlandia corymbosa var. corymbosa TaxID=529605 RepID=A0AAV1BXN6_OLDCO|nr:OLC1v1022354C1 [Oldenlandia corymbosa var. corymbosa]